MIILEKVDLGASHLDFCIYQLRISNLNKIVRSSNIILKSIIMKGYFTNCGKD
jgi:hypothetical protein